MTHKVLVVDDSKLARMAIAKALTALHPDWERVEASNADEALALLKETEPDLAVVDFNMPGRDGLTLAAEFRALRPGMPVAIISANHQQEVIARVRAVGATFLSKPVAESAIREFLSTAAQQLGTAGT